MSSEENANIAVHLPAVAAAHPDTLAVVLQSTKGGQLEYRECSALELNSESDRLAHGLDACGIGRGVRTVLMVTPLKSFTVTELPSVAVQPLASVTVTV